MRLSTFRMRKLSMRFKTLGLKWHEMPNIMDTVFGGYEAAKDDVLLVDVGGSSGHDLVSFRSRHPDMTGRLILQDLPEAIEAARAVGQLKKMGIEAFEHDFFTPEDVCGARVYYLKMVLHDWPDEQCKQILSNLTPALKQGHSRILLNEIIIPETGASWFETSVDMIMMVCHSAQERRERQERETRESSLLPIVYTYNVYVPAVVDERPTALICYVRLMSTMFQ